MNAKQAKEISLDDFLLRLGFEPAQTQGHSFWYFSPFRQERSASFKLSADRRAWYDHGEGVGGNILDFAIRFWQLGTVSEALVKIGQVYGDQPITPRERPVILPEQTGLTFVKSDTVRTHWRNRDTGLVEHTPEYMYLDRRGLNFEKSYLYIRKVWFKNQHNKTMFALGFPNDKRGWEVRARINEDDFKGLVGQRSYTFIPAKVESQRLEVFESFLDFLTFLSCFDRADPQTQSYLITNGTAMFQSAAEAIRDRSYGPIALWPHQGAGFDKMVEAFSDLPDCQGTMEHLYAGYDDLNAWRQAQLTTPAPQPNLNSSPSQRPNFRP